ncbi:MAG: trigger factor [Armatimonadetes bacterium]|nr:trigger factor [Armatimonadota bacterium]
MQLVTAKQPGSQMDLTFKLEAQDVKNTFSKVYSDLAGRGQIPGFRPGKAPAAVIKRRFKPEVLTDMFWMQTVEDYVEKELEKTELQILGEPEFPDFKEIEVNEDAGLEFTIKVMVRPEPELPDYSGLRLPRLSTEVTDEQVAEVIEEMRRTAGRIQPVEDRTTVEPGDIVRAQVVVDLEGATEPAQPTEEEVEIGSGRYQPAIDEAMVGKSVGDTVELPADYPEDHEDADLAGKSGTVRATIERISVRVLPELDDAFAQSQGEYESLEDLRTQIRAKLVADAQRESEQTLQNDVLAAIVRDTKIELPEKLVQQVASRGFQSFVNELQQAGLTLEQFQEVAGVGQNELLMNELVRAEAGLKVTFTLEALAKAEGIEVDDEALAEEIRLFASENQIDEGFLQQSLELQEGFREQLEERAKRRLTLAAVLAKIQTEEVSAERYAAIKEEERKAREEAARAEAEVAASAEAAASREGDAAEGPDGEREVGAAENPPPETDVETTNQEPAVSASPAEEASEEG